MVSSCLALHHNSHVANGVIAGVHAQLQAKLLNKDMRDLKPETDFLASFSSVVECDTFSLAVSLSLSEEELKEAKKKREGQTHQDHTLHLLTLWAQREDATYGQLYKALTSIPLLHY